jgi:hypothetical protein
MDGLFLAGIAARSGDFGRFLKETNDGSRYYGETND